MFDTVEYFKTIIEYFNESQACDKCWTFDYARHDYSNLRKWSEDEKCCAHFLLHSFKHQTVKAFDSDDCPEVKYIRSTYEIFVGLDSDFTKQIFSEVEQDKESNSKYISYIKPLGDCIGKIFQDDVCAGVDYESYTCEPVYNYKDQNMDGWLIKGSLRFNEGTDVYSTSGTFTEPTQPTYLNYDLNFDI